MIGNKIADAVAKCYDDKITKVSKISPENNTETIASEHNKEICKERYISPERRQEIVDELRLM